MAEIIGLLREDATHGEKTVLRFLRQNLPKEFTVFVEPKLHKKREIRYPDFIILTNYGVIVLEVKDWVIIQRCDPRSCQIRTRENVLREEKNPVDVAREYAFILSSELRSRSSSQPGEAIPWSHAAVLPNIPPSVITQLRTPWGDEFVWGRADLENPDVLLARLKNLFPVARMRALTKSELDMVRGVVYPLAEIQMDDRPPFVLDETQVRLVAEPVRPEAAEAPEKPPAPAQPAQSQLFEMEPPAGEEDGEVLSREGEKISRTPAIRLVRGFSGSGKTLVLIQRARFLQAQYPQWKIGVITFNNPLQKHLSVVFRGSSIKPVTFHSLCRQKVHVQENSCVDLGEWLADRRFEFDIVQSMGKDMVENEINWIRDMGVTTLESYLAQPRRGIGRDFRLSAEQRRAVFAVTEAYRAHLHANNCWDWQELPLVYRDILQHGVAESEQFDALLVDEAQDWAPVWFKALNLLLKPGGFLFLADDPSQSIYRFFSWKEKGINVVGRTRWLRVPYRNTYEIYRAAYSLISDHKEIQAALAEEGELMQPEISSTDMRHGPKPLVKRCANVTAELEFLRNKVESLKAEGFRPNQIAVLARYKSDIQPFQAALRGSEVLVHPIHSYKGLEMEAVLIPHLHKTFQRAEEEAAERRLLYMAMSRARSRLAMTYSGRLPACYDPLRQQQLVDLVI